LKLSIGIVGLPNVGKSTLFNALLKRQIASAEKYPFCTIDPNIGVIEVPDERLAVLAKIVNTSKIIPAIVEFYDIAGLVKGASEGEGLGNKFLSHIREVSTIAHVVRFFEDENVIHVENRVDPESDIVTIDTELALADLATLKKQTEPRMNATKEEILTYQLIKKIKAGINQNIPVRKQNLSEDECKAIQHLNLLTLKPVIYVFNVSESQLENYDNTEDKIRAFLSGNNDKSPYLIICAKLENEILTLSMSEQKEYLTQYHLVDSGLNRLIKKAYDTLGLISYLTAGEKEVRAWTVKKGTLAPQAAGVIHTDFEKNFIKADIIPFGTFVKCNGWTNARELGKVSTVGRNYEIKDGEVVEFKIGQ